MADKNAEVAVGDNGGMKKTLSLWNFFTIGFGAIIGTGWVLQVGDWMVVGGGPVPAMIAFLLGAIFLVPVGAVSVSSRLLSPSRAASSSMSIVALAVR